MRLLAIDTATPRPSLAVVPGAQDPRTAELPRQGAEVLASAVAELLSRAGLSPRDLDRIGVVAGPGSFTGLRSSLAFARGLARATGALLVPVPTFEAASEAIPGPPDVDFLLDALRGEVHRCRRRGGRLEASGTRLARETALLEAARDGVPAIDLGDREEPLAPAAAALAARASGSDPALLSYGRPPAAEERFGPGEAG